MVVVYIGGKWQKFISFNHCIKQYILSYSHSLTFMLYLIKKDLAEIINSTL